MMKQCRIVVAEKLKREMKMEMNDQEFLAWHAGFLASYENDSQESNPYKEGTSNFHIWDDGFECCEMRMKGK